MDRIAALRNIEDALAEYERGETDLESMERAVTGVLRTYATDFDDELAAYRANGDGRADGLIVVATSQRQARERVRELVDDDVAVTVDRVADR
ncbi:MULTISPECIES: hypothetical protein [Halostella]|uniref:DUF7854 family protein n=1 Tax=Halostella TaxID=1843185 RepID=UPI0010821E56|nr:MULTISPECIES: hypothetical protein [Halostella]